MAVLSRSAVFLLLCAAAPVVFAQSIVQPGAPGKPTQELNVVTAAPRAKGPSDADVKFMQDMIMHHGQAVEMTELAKTRAENPEVTSIASKIDLSQGDEIRWMKQWLAERGYPEEPAGGMAGMAMDHTAMSHGDMPGSMQPTMNATPDRVPEPQPEHAGMDHSQMAGMNHSKMPGMDYSQMDGMDHGAKPADAMDVAPMVGMLTPRQMASLRAARGKEFDRLFLTGMMQHHNGALVMVKDLFQQPGAGQDPQLFDFANDVDNTQLAEIDIMKGILRKVTP